ncbi:hypothetical protein [Mesoterricola silvestris]|uniref:Uncharacterized protein n=1 Tax=Mesoterricola silvestris TaxID=2927979 RepID=A0AA48GU99_9BACT|nr:hypothetical protein [Mesoterricola silvestris]BDU74177.1 hypothetical protein METEAL_33510 [Mesoterricola silvestris]
MIAKALLFVFSCSIALAGPWEDFVQAHHKAEAARKRWTLCVAPGTAPPVDLLADPDYQRLAASADWGVEGLGAAPAQDLLASRSAQWALLAPNGEVAGVGKGRPQGTALLDAIHAVGARARWEERDAFLKQNPGQGEARREVLEFEMRILKARLASLDRQGRIRVPAWHPEPGTPSGGGRITLAGAGGDGQASDLYPGVGQALANFSRVDGWYREGHWLANRLALFDLGQSGALRGLFQDLASEVGERAAGEPDNAGLVELWMEILDGARYLPAALPGNFHPVPGAVWPTPQVLDTLLEPLRRRRDLQGELKLLADLTPQAPPEPLTPRGWEEHCDLQAALLSRKASALAGLGAWDQARAALDAAGEWGGVRAAPLVPPRHGGQDPSANAAWRRLLAHTVQHHARRPPMPHVAPPLRITLLGRPPWLLAWTALRDAPELAPWSPGELRWEIASHDAFVKLRAHYGWTPEPRWALFQGKELRATGETCPGPQALAGVLAGQATPLLERLGRAIAREPGGISLRAARFHAVLARMPDRRLEPLLAEDAARAHLVLPFRPKEGWKPSPALWGGAAETVLPQLESLLRAWPTDAALWRAWISWAPFHPGHPSILAQAQGLPYWFPDGDWRTALPYDVQRAVAAELRRQGDFNQMRDWFQASWDVLDHRSLRDLRPWERSWYHERRVQEDTAVFQPLREALRALGLHEQQIELERTFGAMMGRDVSRSR